MEVISEERRAALTAELAAVMRSATTNVVVYGLFRDVGRVLRLKDTLRAKALVAAGLAAAVWLLAWIANRVAGLPITADEALILAVPAVVAGVCLWLIRVIEETMFLKKMALFAAMPADEPAFHALMADFRAKFRHAPQWVFALVFGGIGLYTTSMVCAGFPRLAHNAGFYTGTALMALTIGMGAYFAVMLPTLMLTVARHRLVLYPYNPAQSRLIAEGMASVGQLTLGTGVAAALIMALLFAVHPWGRQMTFNMALGWLIFVWGLTTYTYVLPFAAASMAIKREKMLQVERISVLIKQLDNRFTNLNNVELERLQKLVELRQQVFQSRDTPIETAGFRDYITSLVLPAGSFLVGSFETLRELARSVLM